MTIDYGNKHHQKAMTLAAGHFLSEVPDTWEELHALLQALDEAQNEDYPTLPDNYTPWEAVEDYRPEEVYDFIENLAMDFLIFGESNAKLNPHCFLPREIIALGNAIERGDPQDIADKWLGIKPLLS